MKVLQVNVWQGRITRPLLHLVNSEQPDVIFAQEVFSYPEAIPPTSPWIHLGIASLLAGAAGLPHSYFAPSTTFSIFGQKLSYGNLIISRYPFSHTSTHYTGGVGPVHFEHPTTVDHNATRNFQHVVIDNGEATLNLINHHGHWAPQPLGDETSVARLQLVAGYIAGLTGPVLMAGDLNLSSESPALSQFIATTKLRNLVAGSTIKSTLSSAHYVDQPIVCDHILVSPGISAAYVKTSDQIVSDHKAIIAEIIS